MSNISAKYALQEALLEFTGYAVVISRDRWFLDRIGLPTKNSADR